MLKKLALSTVATLGLVWGVDDLEIVADDGHGNDLTAVLAASGTQKISASKVVAALTADLDITATNSISVLSDLDFSGVSAANMLRFIAGNGTGTGEINIGSEDTNVTLTWNKPGNLEFNTGWDGTTPNPTTFGNDGTFTLHTGSTLAFNGEHNKADTNAWTLANRQEMWIRAKNPWDNAEEQVYVRPDYSTTAITYGADHVSNPDPGDPVKTVYHLINSVAEWNKVATGTSDTSGDANYWGTYWSKNYALGDEIGSAGTGVSTKLGSATVDGTTIQDHKPFTGSFHGLGQKLHLLLNTTGNFAAPIGYAEAPTTSDVSESVALTGSEASTTPIVIESVALTGSVVGARYVGGLIGYMGDSTAKDKSNLAIRHIHVHDNLIIKGKDYIGGLAGGVTNVATTQIYNNHLSNVSILQASASTSRALCGGLLGVLLCHGDSTSGRSHVFGNELHNVRISTEDDRVGGLIGQVQNNAEKSNILISNNHIMDTIIVTEQPQVGRVVGRVSRATDVTTSTHTVTIENNTVATRIQQTTTEKNSLVGGKWESYGGTLTLQYNTWVIPVGGSSLSLVATANDASNWLKTTWVTKGTDGSGNPTFTATTPAALEIAVSKLTEPEGISKIVFVGDNSDQTLTVKTNVSLGTIQLGFESQAREFTISSDGGVITSSSTLTLTPGSELSALTINGGIDVPTLVLLCVQSATISNLHVTNATSMALATEGKGTLKLARAFYTNLGTLLFESTNGANIELPDEVELTTALPEGSTTTYHFLLDGGVIFAEPVKVHAGKAKLKLEFKNTVQTHLNRDIFKKGLIAIKDAVESTVHLTSLTPTAPSV